MNHLNARLWILALFIFCISCNSAERDSVGPQNNFDREPGIIGGERVSEGDLLTQQVAYLCQVDITNGNLNSRKFVGKDGTAVVISDRFAITSAHTFATAKAMPDHLPNGDIVEHKILLRFGAHTNQSTSDLYIPFSDLSNPSVVGNRVHDRDYVFIKLPTRIAWPVREMLLSTNPSKYQVGTTIKIAGFGINDVNNSSQIFLKKGELTIEATKFTDADRMIAKELLQMGDWFKEFFLKTNESGSTSFCGGDSGGPLYYDTFVDGKLEHSLVGIHIGQGYISNENRRNCKGVGYALPVNAFYDDAVDYFNKLKNGG